MSLIAPITSVSSGLSATYLILYRSAVAVATPGGEIAYRQLQDAIQSGSLVDAQRAYAALQQAGAANRAANEGAPGRVSGS